MVVYIIYTLHHCINMVCDDMLYRTNLGSISFKVPIKGEICSLRSYFDCLLFNHFLCKSEGNLSFGW